MEAGRLARLGALSEDAERLFKDGGGEPRKMSHELGLLAREAQSELSDLGLVDPAVAALVAAGEASGSPGGKMSGAGGGGAFWLVYADETSARLGETILRQSSKSLGLDMELSLEVHTIGA